MTRIAVPSKELQLHIIGSRGDYAATRIQRLTLSSEIPSETKDELGNSAHVGEAKDTPNVTLSFSAFDVGVRIFSALTGTDATAYPAGGVDISNLGQVDAAIYVKDPDVSDYVKSIHAHKLQIRDFSFSYTVDGDSTEDYTAIGSSRRYLKYDVQTDLITEGTTSFTLTETPLGLNNGDHLLSVILDGTYLDEVTGTPATGQYSVAGTTVTTFDSRVARFVAVYHSNPSGTNWSDVGDVNLPVAIRGKDVDISISANDISRVQSVNLNGNLNVTAVKELGNREVVGYQSQVPTIEGSLTVLDTDTDLISLLTYGTVGSGMEWMPGEGCANTTVTLKIELKDPCDVLTPFDVKKTVYLSEIVVTGESYTSNVNDNASQTFNFKSNDASCVIYSGAM